MVTVVDAITFVAGVGGALDAAGAPTDRSGGGGGGGGGGGDADEDHSSIADLMAAQVEAADVVVISRGDAAPAAALAATQSLVRELNPGAEVVVSGLGAHPGPEALLSPRGAARAGWAARLDAAAAADDHHDHDDGHEHDDDDDDHHHHHYHAPAPRHGGISSFVFSAPGRPFHPARLLAALEAEAPWAGVLRSKGWFWLATRPEQAGLWQAAGGAWRGEGAGPWGEDAEDVGGGAEAGPGVAPGQRLVFIGGPTMNRAAIEAALKAALLTPEEADGGAAAWAEWEDELPEWAGDEEVD
jgi:G3E family GTPase